MSRDTRLVYSTETGRIKEPKEPLEAATGSGRVRVQLEKSGRAGKWVTCIYELPLKKNDLNALAKKLKKRCGSGGAVKNGVVEIQGDFADLLVRELQREGFEAKRSGA